jgi:pyruvate dehydrogenase E2 component (dihydrolipoamide acetyltransferase)
MYVVRMPRLGITMQTGKVLSWLKKEGEPVKQGETLFELETEKSVVEVEAQAAGVLRKVLLAENEEVESNTPIAVIGAADEEIDLSRIGDFVEDEAGNAGPVDGALTRVERPPSPAQQGQRSVAVSPRVRRLAAELRVDLAALGIALKGAPIGEDDVRAAAQSPSATAEGSWIDLTTVQRSMKGHIARSWAEIPHFTQIVSVDMTRALEVRKQRDEAGLNDILVKVTGTVAAAHPKVNGRLDGDRIRTSSEANVSVAIATDAGLVVPVVRSVQGKAVTAVAAEIKELAKKGREGRFAPADFEGGTITFSNLGAYGIETGTPIINAPQSTLVFAGAIMRTVVPGENDAIRIAPIMKLSVCFDHRFIDGVTAAAFTTGLKTRLENLVPADLD